MVPARVTLWLRNRCRPLALAATSRIVDGWHAASNLLFPPACTFCGGEMAPQTPMLCAACVALLSGPTPAACGRCAHPLPRHWSERQWCPRCRGRRYHFDRAVALGCYRADLRQAVLRMKRPTAEPLTHSMGLLLGNHLRETTLGQPADCVVPVPMHWNRRLHRGTNTALILGAAVGKCLGRPCLGRLLRCRHKTRKQGTLRPAERFVNVRDAFRVSTGYDITEARVLLIDDIMTTGATLSEAAKELRRGGARSVEVAVVARGTGAL